QLAGHALDVVLAARDDEAGHLVLEQRAVGDGFLVLDAVHALYHLVVEAARRAPADRCRDQQDIGPVHERLVHAVELVLRVHLGDGARPGAGVSALGIVPFARPEFQLAQADQLRLAAEPVRGVTQRFLQQRFGGAVARIAVGHYGGRDTGNAY